MKPITFFPATLAAILGIGTTYAESTVVDAFSGDLSAYTSTVILDANGGANNTATWQITTGVLQLNTTTYDGIQQYAFVRSGLTLAVGEELQLDITHTTASQDIGLYVGGTTPVAGTRQDYVNIYARGNGQIFSRGFDGPTEFTLAGGATPAYNQLFIARTATNTYEAGYYNGVTRTIVATRTPATPNDADTCGFYADVRAAGTLGNADNLCVANITPEYLVSIDDMTFSSGEAIDTTIGVFSATADDIPENSTFSLVAGEGDTDNGLFKIGGAGLDELQINADFTSAGEDPFTGQTYSVRVRGTDNATSSLTVDLVITLTVFKDDDLDLLDDEWENFWQGNLTDLNGTGGFDKDTDGLEDQEEYMLSLGTFPGFTAFASDPDKSDTDDDMLTDGEETLDLVGDRPATDPTKSDTDFDGLTDFEETNSFSSETLPFVGTDGTFMDTDGDGAKDGYEVDNGTDPLDDTAYPASTSGSVTVAKITDDASTGISTAKTYTHAISGGYATTVNGVAFGVLIDVTTPTNFEWTTTPDGKNLVGAANLNGWFPESGNVTGTGIIDLLSGFTYSNGAATPEGLQTFTLSGLTPGAQYELRIYTRAWSPVSDSGRLLDLTFRNGDSVIQPWNSLAMDRPGYVLDSLNNDEAYFISYTYTAESSEISFDAVIPRGADPGDSGFDGMHLYGLTNELIAGSTGGLAITNISFDAGDLKITFSPGGAGYILSSSNDLDSAFTPETNATYDGINTFTVPATFLDPDGNDFFRVESAP